MSRPMHKNSTLSELSCLSSTLDVDIFGSDYKANLWYPSELESAFNVGAQMMFCIVSN